MVGKINILYPSINSGNMPIESSNLASLRTSSEVRLYLLKKINMNTDNCRRCSRLKSYRPTIFRESLVPMVMPKFLNRALEKPGITDFKAVKARRENKRMKKYLQVLYLP